MEASEDRATVRDIPSVDRLLGFEGVQLLLENHPRSLVVGAVRDAVNAVRSLLQAGEEIPLSEITPDAMYHIIEEFVHRGSQPSLRRAVNATGIILHTGLGRAPLAEAAIDAAVAAAGACTLEIDPETGKRGSRTTHIEPLLTELTGAQAGMAVNNNAAAVLLAINTLASGKEVIVSRGQLVEIGGSFRVPDIILRSGCRLVEVGTTNKTRIEDYRRAITDDTALILRVHPSNFRIVGFTEEASLEELVGLGREIGIPVMDDLGSGAFVDLARWGLADEPLAKVSVQAGCDVVTFSGDKLLGGPQAGMLVGRLDVIEACKKNALTRALRLDKLTLAALEATLKLYKDPDDAAQQIPVLQAITARPEVIRARAEDLAGFLRSRAADLLEISVVAGVSHVGGGSLPGEELPTALIALKSVRFSAEDLSETFRAHRVPIFGRISEGMFLLDVRTLGDEDIEPILACASELGEVADE